MNDLTARAAAALADRAAKNLLRERRVARRLDHGRIDLDGAVLIDAASNDYLGLSNHPDVVAAFAKGAAEFGAGSGASALVSGYSPAHQSAEAAIARWKSVPAAVLLGSGYAANQAAVAAMSAIAGPGGIRFLIDKLAHASLVDAVRCIAPKHFRVFGHNDMTKLHRLLSSSPSEQMQVVVTESIFSMDGDAANLPALAELKQKFGFSLLLDEAHGSGVFGPGGAGYAAELNLQSMVDVTVVTLSKALGVAGGAVCGSAEFIEAVVNFARPYIYSTNLPPGLATAIETAIDIVQHDSQPQQRLAQLTSRVRSELARRGVNVLPGIAPIIPVLMGDEHRCLIAAETLRRDGIYTVAIRPPTVPAGSSRLRITLSSAMSDEDIGKLIEAVASCI